MAGMSGRQGRLGQVGAERGADDRRDAGAADHLHDRDAPHRRGLQGHAAQGQATSTPRPEGDNEVILGIDEYGQLLPQRTGRLQDAALEDQLRSIFAARTEDKILYFKADNQLKYGQDTGGRRDRTASRASA